jgi:uncharacterized membrane protein
MGTGKVTYEKNRIWEIDLLRFLAIVLMVTFHLVYDLNEFVHVNVEYEFGFWYYVGAISAILFIFISGISSGFSRNTFKRGLKVFGFGMVITIVTYFFDSSQYIRFGILHFLGVSMMLFPLLKKINNGVLLILGAFLFVVGKFIENLTLNTVLLLPFGFMYGGFASMDYYPLFPYISYFILGILCYKLFYYKKRSLFEFNFNVSLVQAVGKHSLIIYLLHQPLMLGIIYLLQSIK